uniref:Uncharacterized protein n=1 Tax=Candidozyma auris TaxID=498019 RepID=A0A0L0P7Q3_CANAR
MKLTETCYFGFLNDLGLLKMKGKYSKTMVVFTAPKRHLDFEIEKLI